MSAIFFSALVYLPQFFEKVLGFTALRAGAGLLPMMGVFAVTSFVAGSLYNRLGARVVIASGAITLALGMFALSFLDADSSYASLVPGLVILGIGIGLFYSSITTVGVTALDPSRSSLAGGIIYMCQIAGGAVGLGLNIAIVGSPDALSGGDQRGIPSRRGARRLRALRRAALCAWLERFPAITADGIPPPSHRHRHRANA
jgi:MFS family permease